MERRALRLVRRAHGWLVGRYPAAFRDAFAVEIAAVFARLLAEAAGRGRWAALALCWRELVGLLGGLRREHRRDLGPATRQMARRLTGAWRGALVPTPTVGASVTGTRVVALLTATLIWLPALLALMLVALTPLAVALTPYEGIYRDGVYQATLAADPRYPLRAALIGLGLAAPLVGLGGALAALAARRSPGQIILSAALTLFIAAVGWRCFPYWVNGVFQAAIGAAAWTDLDPKALLPARWSAGAWLGNAWLAGVLLLYPVVWLGGPLLVGLSVWAARRGPRWTALATTALVAATLATFLITPRYGWWLMD